MTAPIVIVGCLELSGPTPCAVGIDPFSPYPFILVEAEAQGMNKIKIGVRKILENKK